MKNLWARLTGAVQPKARQEQQKPLLTVADVIREYQGQRTNVGNLDAARERAKHLKLFSLALGHRPIAQVKAHEMLKYLQTSFPGCRSPWTLRRIVVTIKTPFNWAARYGLIDRNPFTAVSQEQGEPGRIMTEAEFHCLLRTTVVRKSRRLQRCHLCPERQVHCRRLCKRCYERMQKRVRTGKATWPEGADKRDWPRRAEGSAALFRRVLIFIRHTGCRPAECSRLEWSMYDEANARFVLHRHKTSHRRTGKPRVLYLTECLVRLVTWIRRHDPHPKYVFTNYYGTPFTPGAMQKRVRRLVKLTGLDKKVTLYGARRLYGTTAIMNGSDLSTTAELMGNSPAILQKHYVQLSGQIDHLRQKVGCGMPAGKPPKLPTPPASIPKRPSVRPPSAPAPPASYRFGAGA